MSQRLRAATISAEARVGDSAVHGAASLAGVPASELPASWLAKLLQVSCSLPLEDGHLAVASALVCALHELLPNHAFSISLRGHATGTAPFACPKTEALPFGVVSSTPSLSDYPHARQIEFDAEHGGVLLRAASVDALSVVDGGAIDLLLTRAANVLKSALRTARLVNAKGRESLELQGQIIQSEKLASLGQIAAGVVHELNNPLTSIVGYSDYLHKKAQREQADPNDIERLRRISEAAGRIMRFSSDLIAYARPSIELPAPIAVHSVIDQAIVFCEHVLGSAKVAVVRQFGTDARPVLGVKDQLIQVFVNLFTNACHAMEQGGGTLTVAAELDAPRAAMRVTVSDTGHGIDPEVERRIFEPFFTTKAEGRGTGLGLSIVRNIITLHRGTIAVESVQGTGTRFVLTIPVAAPGR